MDAVAGEDGVVRCPWGESPPEYRRYHDDEWGRPVTDETRVFEKLSLEGFQSGLSWLTILRKRENFRLAFAGFVVEDVAAFDEHDVERLLGNAGIVRHRGKIEATIANARAIAGLHSQGLSLAALLWRHEPVARPAPRLMGDLPASTPESVALSKELRGLGFRFVGPTTVYAAMQALGVVNDHLESCHARPEAEAARSSFVRPA